MRRGCALVAALILALIAFAGAIATAQQVPNPVAGAPSAVSGNVPLFDGTTGRKIKDGGLARPRAFRSKNFYVDPTGLDAADCLAATVGGGHGPCKTIYQGLAAAMASDPMPPTGPTNNPPTANTADHLIINLACGAYLETVTVNGNAAGLVNASRWLSQYNSPMIVLKGAGSGCVEIAGPTLDACYTILAVNGAYLGLEGLSVRSDAAGGLCPKSNLYVQLATMYVLNDVKLKAATGQHVMLEESANFYVTPGYQPPGALTLAGNAQNGIFATANSTFTSDSTIGIEGSLSMAGGGGFLFFADEASVIKLLMANPAVTPSGGGNSVTGRRFGIYGNSFLRIGTPPAVWPGSRGLVEGGSRYRSPDNVVCIGGAPGCQATDVASGLGTGGSVTSVAGGSGPYGGFFELTAGTGAANSGSIYVGFPYEMSRGVCAVTRANGTGTWNPLSTYAVNGFTNVGGLAIGWANNSVALEAGKTYFLGWVCNTST